MKTHYGYESHHNLLWILLLVILILLFLAVAAARFGREAPPLEDKREDPVGSFLQTEFVES